MENNRKQVFIKMNELGRKRQPFIFLFDFDLNNTVLLDWEEAKDKLLWQTPHNSNSLPIEDSTKPLKWEIMPVSYGRYEKAFGLVQSHIHNGDSYLLNLTMPTKIETNHSLEEIFHMSKASYRIFLKNEFVCFSPETFVRIENGEISSFPMKGTIDANLPDAEKRLKTDTKELAEHNTIVDLIRNDLSRVSEKVEVRRFCYIDKIRSNKTDLLQMSSEITGELPENYHEHLGDIFEQLLPAGSISGAPKKRTIEVIKKAEKYDRGYYTGIFGVFDGVNIDSCVLIRYLEKDQNQLIFKSGGGITHLSQCESEYREMVKKVYVPIT